jgi:hypothetical protein
MIENSKRETLSLIPEISLLSRQISLPLNPFGTNVTKFPESEDFTDVKSTLTMSACRESRLEIDILLDTSLGQKASKNVFLSNLSLPEIKIGLISILL